MPGISDLDFLLVVEPNELKKNQVRKVFDDLSKREKYIGYLHLPYLVDVNYPKDLFEFMPLSNMNLVYGKSNNFISSQNENLEIVKELIISFYPNCFLRPLFEKNIDVRKCIMICNALQFPIKLSNIEKKTTFSNYLKKLSDFKFKYYLLNQSEQKRLIIELVELAYVTSIELIDYISKQNSKQYNNKLINKNLSISVKQNTFYTAFDNYNFIYQLQKYIFLLTNKIPAFLPYDFVNTVNELSNVKSEKVSSNLIRYQKMKRYFTTFDNERLGGINPYPFYIISKHHSLRKYIMFCIIKIIIICKK